MEFKVLSAEKGGYNEFTKVKVIHIESGKEFSFSSKGFDSIKDLYDHFKFCYEDSNKSKTYYEDKWIKVGDVIKNPRQRRIIRAVMMNGKRHTVAELNSDQDENEVITKITNEKSVMTSEDKVIMICNVEYFKYIMIE